MRKIEQVIDDIRASIEIDKPEVAKCYEPYFREILEIHEAEKNGIPLEQIRDEIAQLHSDMNVINYNLAIGNVLDIIDKYRGEQNDKRF